MTIIRVEYDGVIYDLDVLEQTPIRVDVSAIENSEIGDVFGASSQTFTLPGSRKNNRFFKHAYKVGVTNVPGLGESVRASVITNSNTLLEGSLFLEEVIRTPFDGVNYQVVITNDVVSFNESIMTVAVKDLDWDSYDHTLSLENITGSWTDNLFSGDVLYPLVDFGQDGVESTGSVPLVEIDSSGVVGYMNNSSTPLQVQQFSPSIRVSTVLDKIFEEGGFSYTSSLQPLFDQLYILPKQTETLSVKGSGFSDYGFVAEGASAQIVPAGSSNVTVEFPTETYDPTNSFNTSTSIFTIPKAGSYVITGFINYAFSSQYVVGDVTIRMYRNSSIIAESTQTFGGSTTSLQEVNLSTPATEGEYTYFNSGDEIKIEITYSASAPYNPNITLLSYSRFRTTVTPINYATGTVQLGQQFDPQTKCIDILKGLIEKFNLIVEPVYTENKVLSIEPYETWIGNGAIRDWTRKVEKAKRIAIKSPLSSQPKSLIFEDAKDNDKLAKQVIENAEGFQWGTEVIDAVSDVPQGEKKVGSYFSPTILQTIPGAGTNNVIPQLYKTDNSKVEKKTFKHKPKLGYKITGSLSTTCYIGDDADEFTDYATISNYDSIPVVSGSTNNLHYNDSFYVPTFTNTVGSKTAYDNYWNYYVTELYDADNRILNLDLEFIPEEIRDIKLNNIIFIEDNVYRINKISGYNLVNPDIVNVELIRLPKKDIYSIPSLCCQHISASVSFTALTSESINYTQEWGGFNPNWHNELTWKSAWDNYITDGFYSDYQYWVAWDYNPRNQVTTPDPSIPYVVTGSNGEIFGVKGAWIANATYPALPLGSEDITTLKFNSGSDFLEPKPDSLLSGSDALPTTVVITGKVDTSFASDAKILEERQIRNKSQDNVDKDMQWMWNEIEMFYDGNSVASSNTYQLQSGIDKSEFISNLDGAGVGTIVLQFDPNGALTENAQTVLSLRTSGNNSFKDVAYYTNDLGGGVIPENILMLPGYNLISNDMFEYIIAHQHIHRLLDTDEMLSIHEGNLSRGLYSCDNTSCTTTTTTTTTAPTTTTTTTTTSATTTTSTTTTSTTTTSTTTTTTLAAASLNIYARTLIGSEFTTIYYKVNGGTQQSAYTDTLTTTCGYKTQITGLLAGDVVELYTDELENISGSMSLSCPTSVNGDLSFTTPALSGGTNTVALTVDTGATTTSTTSTTTTTTAPTTTTTTTTTLACTGSQYGTHTAYVPGTTPGNATFVWSGFSTGARNFVIDITGESSPVEGTQYSVNVNGGLAYSSSCELLSDINFSLVSSQADWDYDGSQTTVTVTSAATTGSAFGVSDNVKYDWN